MFSYYLNEYKPIIEKALDSFPIEKDRIHNILKFRPCIEVDKFVKIRVYIDNKCDIRESYNDTKIIAEYEKRIEIVNKAFEENGIDKQLRLEYEIEFSMKDLMNKIRNGIILEENELNHMWDKFDESDRDLDYDTLDHLMEKINQENPFHLLILYKMFKDYLSKPGDNNWKDILDFTDSLSKMKYK